MSQQRLDRNEGWVLFALTLLIGGPCVYVYVYLLGGWIFHYVHICVVP